MHFDDRLATVLQHRAAGERAARVQFRQLLDLLGEQDGGRESSLTRAAYRRLDALRPMIPAAQRERLAGECSPRIRNPRLLAWFAGGEPRVALAALSRAALSDGQWLALIPQLPIGARGLLRHRRNLPPPAQNLLDRLGVHDRILPEPVSMEAARAPAPDASAPARAGETAVLDLGRYAEGDYVPDLPNDKAAPASDRPAKTAMPPDSANLGALVRRIEAFQRARQERSREAGPEAPRLPLGGEAAEERPARAAVDAFLFTTDETGRIDWAQGAAAPLVVGTMLAPPGSPSGFAVPFGRRRPMTGVVQELGGAEAIAGQWLVDAAPRFAPRSARFTGYVGRFRRPPAPPGDARAARAADRVRQLLHELRTPVTAIQGFAEVIQQQTVGPVPHEYRALAAGIAGDAARMLAGFAEIERLARLEAGIEELPEGSSDFAAIARRQVAQLQTVLSPRVSRIEANFALHSATVPLASESAETIAWRFLGTLASAIAAGERMRLTLDAAGANLRLAARLPAALAHAEDVFSGEIHPVGGALGIGLLGAGFALRLARAEARAAGGDLVREGLASMILTLPLGEAQRAPEHRPDRAAVETPDTPAPAPLAQSPRAR